MGLDERGNERDSTMVGATGTSVPMALGGGTLFYLYGGLELPEEEKMLPILFHKPL